MTGRHSHRAGARTSTSRRTFVRALGTVGGAVVLGGAGWWALADESTGPAQPLGSPGGPLPPENPAIAVLPEKPAVPAGPYGVLAPADASGLRLPAGFTSRIVARSRQQVPGSEYVWHDAPDGGACFPDGDGWVYVSNSELSDGAGGVGVLRFTADATLLGGYRVLDGTNRNCAGGATPWGTWLSCEESSRGLVYETFPLGGREAIRHDAMGAFRHEAAAVDPVRRCVYLTEDRTDGCFYRYVPDSWPDLAAGGLEVLCGEQSGPVRWEPVPDPAAARRATRNQVRDAVRFNGGEGCVYGEDSVWFTTKGDGKLWRLHAPTQKLSVVYDEASYLDVGAGAPVSGLDNLARSAVGELFIAEDKGSLDIGLISPNGRVSVFAHLDGHLKSEITGPAFSPDGSRLYFSSQRGQTNQSRDGYTFEVSGPFHHLQGR